MKPKWCIPQVSDAEYLQIYTEITQMPYLQNKSILTDARVLFEVSVEYAPQQATLTDRRNIHYIDNNINFQCFRLLKNKSHITSITRSKASKFQITGEIKYS